MLVDGRAAEVTSGASYDSSGGSGEPNPQASPTSHSGTADQHKLVILGLPWSTVEATLLVSTACWTQSLRPPSVAQPTFRAYDCPCLSDDKSVSCAHDGHVGSRNCVITCRSQLDVHAILTARSCQPRHRAGNTGK